MRGSRNHLVAVTVAVVLLAAAAGTWASAQTSSGASPPRTIADIATILDNDKPNAAAISARRAEADAAPPRDADRATLARFFYRRSQARALLGKSDDARLDAEQAVEYGQGQVPPRELSLFRQAVALQWEYSGHPKKAIEAFLAMTEEPGPQALSSGAATGNRLINGYRHIVQIYLRIGDIANAENYANKIRALISERRATATAGGFLAATSEANFEVVQAKLFEARGEFDKASAAYQRAEEQRRASIRSMTGDPLAPPKEQLEIDVDVQIANQGRMKARLGRLAEGEADIRRALLSRLETTGKFHVETSDFIGVLSDLLFEEGRFIEAERLIRAQIEVLETLRVAPDAQNLATAWYKLAGIASLQGRWSDAAEIYRHAATITRTWDETRKEELEVTPERIITLYKTNDIAAGIADAKLLLARTAQRFGEQHLETARARGLLAVGLGLANDDVEALNEYQAALTSLSSTSGQNEDDDSSTVIARDLLTRMIIESYISLRARVARSGDATLAMDTFTLAEAIKGHAVQNALTAAAARLMADDRALTELVRSEQDLQKRIGAQLGLLNNVLALPPSERDDGIISQLRSTIGKLQSEHGSILRAIEQEYPQYADLVRPKPPTVVEIQRALKSDEAFVSFYFGQDGSFVWVVPKSGPIAFVPIAVTANDIAARIARLRQALQPDAETIGDIPAFDLKGAYDLYNLLLKPVEATWRPAPSLIVATNGALGLLPLSLLPTAPATLDENAEPLFAGYRKVPWLARTHAVTMVPSAAALLTLRQLPAGATARDKFVGFGDPYFNAEEAREATDEKATAVTNVRTAEVVVTRGIPLRRRSVPQTESLNSADLGVLPRLPDTADELRSIALALDTDPETALHLGKDANEHEVETLGLSKFRIVAFATHGLLPGDLDGLTQPALALTAPAVAGVDGDGLLTMSKILSLKLDADWVVLSACNSGAGAGADAEAASGLGRAFFYAGSRAILVTNWSVHSASARELVSDLFHRQAADAKISRAEALRQAMLAMIDGKGYRDDDGKILFAYAHPLFWAPYTIVGDGG